MYLNVDTVGLSKNSKWLTLTWDVFKFGTLLFISYLCLD